MTKPSPPLRRSARQNQLRTPLTVKATNHTKNASKNLTRSCKIEVPRCHFHSEDTPKTKSKARKNALVFASAHRKPKIDEKKSLWSVRERLSAYTVPDRLPCREQHFDQVFDFVTSSLKSGQSRTLYISGVPGTGKTATVLQVIRKLQREKRKLQIDFLFIEVNGMRLTDPAQAFVEIYAKLNEGMDKENEISRKVSAAVARKKLSQIFEFFDKDRLPIVLVVDELDLLMTKRQEVLYEIFNWVQTDDSRLVILAIANTLDLPERLLNSRVSSRIGVNRLSFAPYNHTEIEQILTHRLGDCTTLGENNLNNLVVDPKSVQLISRRVAAVTGDLREAMDLTRCCIDVALRDNNTELTFNHVVSVLKERAGTSQAYHIRSLSRQSEWLLRSAAALNCGTGRDELCLGEILNEYRLRAKFERLRPVTASGAFESCMHMAASRLLTVSVSNNYHNDGVLTRKFRLGVSAGDIKLALDDAENV